MENKKIKCNPMNKEFQDESKRLGMTGNQLIQKYRNEGKFLEKCKKKVKICCNCNSHDTYVHPNGYEHWHTHKCEIKTCTGYLCQNCYAKYDPNSHNYVQKSLTDCRNNNLDPNSRPGIGYITAALVKKFLGIEDCFDITGNFNYPKYDMIEHEYWRKIDAKGSSLRMQSGSLLCHSFGINKNKKADFFFCIGYDEDRKHVKAVFIIPNNEDISKLGIITVPCDRDSKWNEFKESEEEVKKWDDLFHTMKLDNCPILRRRKRRKCDKK